jgi:Ca2+-binding RTX toxin-like protein
VVNRAGVRDYAETTDSTPATGGGDTIDAGSEDDVVLAGTGSDVVRGGAGDDLVLGDNGRVDWLLDSNPAIDRARTTDTGFGAADNLSGNAGADVMLGGFGGDTMYGDDSTGSAGADDLGDVMLGDNGQIDYTGGIISRAVTTDVDAATGGVDIIGGNAGDDRILGGVLGDTIRGNSGNDVAFGDNARMDFASGALVTVSTIDNGLGGADTIRGDEGQDALAGGADADRIDGGTERDLIFGDNVSLDRATGSNLNPRFRALSGSQLYSTAVTSNGEPQVGTASQLDPTGLTSWENFEVTIVDHTFAVQGDPQNRFGNDYLAGGADSDQIFGQLGDDVIQGDGSIDLAVGAQRVSGVLTVSASQDAASDGDDYIEGNGGNDVVFGNLGQDDIIGGSSELFSLDTRNERPDGSDLVFGGAGTAADIARNAAGDVHGRDADVILGDNGNIYRIVGTAGFNYDDGYDQPIVVRAAKVTIDYTPGGRDMVPASVDLGGADELHGESGDDAIYGQTGNDVLFGEGQDDDLIGGWGHDWISGGTGDDGVLGDDGRIFTSRNGPGEALYGVAALPAVQLNLAITTPGNVQNAVINVGGALKKSVDLTPFNAVVGGNELSDPQYADDIIYGGLGGDWLHGGAGDDAISGAEALPVFYGNPSNSGDVLAYNEVSGEFDAYDEFDPRTKIAGFLLNFDHTEGPTVTSATWGTVNTDGDDRIFGDLGNDWLVGGTGRDNLYGGWGDDLINADDNHDSQAGGHNDIPDTHPSYEDRAYGGAGRDRLIANTGGDRLIDWAGEFNSYIVPFAPFGLGTVSRMLAPSLAEFLYDLSESDGADFTRGGDLARNGEPFGELGLVRQQDFAWHDQTGAPDDPQPGNIPGGARDVLRSASFDDPVVTGFFTDSGTFTATNGELRVTAASSSGDAVSVFHVGDALPVYFELQASVKIEKPTAGWKGNAYVIFDYQSPTDFKFAGIDEAINKLVMGHRDANGWVFDKQGVVQGGVKSDQYYNMLVAVNGTNVTILVNNQTVFTHTYQPRIVDGLAFGLNNGYVGVGSDRSRGDFDNVRVQILPPQITFDQTETFNDGVADLFTAGNTGVWGVSGQRYNVSPSASGAMSLLDLGPDHLSHSSYLEMSGKVRIDDRPGADGRAGFVFDRYGDESFKFVAIDADADRLIVGHYTRKGGWVDDAYMSTVINPDQDYVLGITLKGTTVSATLNNAANGGSQAMVGYSFNAANSDGNFGLLARGSQASFDDVRVKTNDPAFVQGQGGNMLASESMLVSDSASTLTQAELDAATVTAMAGWIEILGEGDPRLAGFTGARIQVGDLAADTLGHTEGRTVWIDANAAGYGWSVNGGAMDLATVVSHEFGHVLGFKHEEEGVMQGSLEPGLHYLLEAAGFDADPDLPITDQMLRELASRAARLDAGLAPRFDLGTGQGAGSGIDWNAGAGEGWGSSYSPYAADKAGKDARGNFSDYLVKLFKKGGDSAPAGQGGGYDSLGSSLLGTKSGKGRAR